MLWERFVRCRAALRRQGPTAIGIAVVALAAIISVSMAAAREHEEPRDADGGRPVLGVVVGQPDDAENPQVLRVWQGSPADEAGIEPGDRIVRIGEEEVTSPEVLRAVVLELAPGDEVEVDIVREGESQTRKVRLGGMDEFRLGPRRRIRPRPPEQTVWLGVRMAPEAPEQRRGVVIERVYPRSPAAKAGLQDGDVIVRVDKTRVDSPADVRAAIAARRPEEAIRLVVRRDGERQTMDVTLATFARWHRRIAERFDDDVRDVLRDLVAASLERAEDAMPDALRRRRRMMDEVDVPTLAVAKLTPTEGHHAEGTILLRQTDDGVHLSGEIRGLDPGLRGFHIHEYGDLRGPDGTMAGDHFDPEGLPHGAPGAEEHHAGDLGNVQADEDGVAKVDIHAPWLTLHAVIGRSLIVHAEEDDLETQPTGDAGARAAIGVIGIANPETDDEEP